MSTITVTFQGELSELKDLLPGLFNPALPVTQVARSPILTESELDSTPEDGAWTFDEFTEYWNGLQPGARNFLRELALKPKGLHGSEIKRKFEWNTSQFAGSLSSLMFQLKRFPGKPVIYSRRGYQDGWTYVMADNIAEFVRKLSGG